MKNHIKYWVGFNLVKGIGPVRLERLLQYFGDIQSAWTARSYQLVAAGLNLKLTEQLIQIRGEICLDELIENIMASGVHILTWDDPDYPDRLRQINQSPFVLYLKGDLIEDDVWAVAIVGTRRYSAYGRQIAEDLSQILAGHGITVVSGLARGIDGIAHRQTLDAGGRTIAVTVSYTHLTLPTILLV